MSGSIGSAARQLIKQIFRSAGLEINRYADTKPVGDVFPDPPRKLSVPTPGGSAVPRPAPFVLVASNHGTLIVNRNDHSGEGQRGFGVGLQILETSSFDYDEIKLALTLLCHRMKSHGPGVVAIDCGANIGVHTIEWARQMSGWGDVISIEAQERIFYALCGNITINNCMNARAIWAAVGATSGKMRIPVPDYNRPASFGSLELRKRQASEFIGQTIDYSDETCATVDVLTIDNFQLERLDFLKIDVEGMEVDVLEGAERMIATHKPIMIIEILKSKPLEIVAFLNRHGYRHHRFRDNILAFHESDPAAAAISVTVETLTVESA